MTAQRHEENAEFLHAKAEDEAALALLIQARTVLSSYSKNNNISMGEIQGSVKLIQQGPEFEISADQAPDADFASSGSRKGESKGIVSIMTMLIEDLNDEISNSMKAEASAQQEYEKMLAAAEQLKQDLITKVDNLETTIARLGQEKADEHTDMEQNQADLKDEQDYKASITPDCDWIMGSFGERSKKRTAEMSGLVSAKSLLAGMKSATALLQEAEKVPTATRKVRFLGIGSV